jgi:hypothetical protein
MEHETSTTTRTDDLLRNDPRVPEAVRRYIGNLEAGAFEAAASAFAPSCLYSRDAGPGGGGREELTTPEAVLAFFHARGKQDWIHHVEVVINDGGPRTIVEGHVAHTDGPALASFCGSFEVDEDGLLVRSVGYTAYPPIGTASQAETH